MDDVRSMSVGAAPESTNTARYLSKRAIGTGGKSAPQGTPSEDSSSATAGGTRGPLVGTGWKSLGG